MTIALQYCHVTVNDLDESLGFYRDALGLEVRDDVASGGFRWVTLGSPDQPGLGIVFSEPHAGGSQADGDILQELLTKGVVRSSSSASTISTGSSRRWGHPAPRCCRSPSISRGGRATARSAIPRATWSGSRRCRRRSRHHYAGRGGWLRGRARTWMRSPCGPHKVSTSAGSGHQAESTKAPAPIFPRVCPVASARWAAAVSASGYVAATTTRSLPASASRRAKAGRQPGSRSRGRRPARPRSP